jgi:hypothetical protein
MDFDTWLAMMTKMKVDRERYEWLRMNVRRIVSEHPNSRAAKEIDKVLESFNVSEWRGDAPR